MKILYRPTNGAYDVIKGKIEEFAVENGTFSFDFSNVKKIEEIKGYVYPGFIDAHAHLVGTGKKMLTPNLENVKSVEELLEIASKGTYTVLRGWNEEKLGRYPKKEELDEISRPLMVVRRCGHVGVANDAFMKMVNVKVQDGILRENLLTKALNALKEDEEELLKAVKAGEKEFFKHGVTSVHSDDMYSLRFESVKNALKQVKMDVYEHYHIHSLDELNEFIEMGKPLNSIKVLLDGSLGGHTAYLRKPYADAQTRGVLNFSMDEFTKIVKRADENGVQVVAHVIGDGALDMALRVFENTDPALRHRLVHVQISDEGQLHEIKEEKLCVDVQPQFFLSDEKMAIERLGDRSRFSYRFKEMIDLGIPTAFSSDSPVEIPDPLAGIRAAKRMSISVEESLKAYTLQGAYQEFSEEGKGLFAEGMKADFVVLSEPIEFETSKVIATYKNGEMVFSR